MSGMHSIRELQRLRSCYVANIVNIVVHVFLKRTDERTTPDNVLVFIEHVKKSGMEFLYILPNSFVHRIITWLARGLVHTPLSYSSLLGRLMNLRVPIPQIIDMFSKK